MQLPLIPTLGNPAADPNNPNNPNKPGSIPQHLTRGAATSHNYLSYNNTLNDYDKRGIGEWAEAFVYRVMSQSESAQGAVVEWLNESEEQRKPFDLRVVYPDGRKLYIEVKGTKSLNKMLFEISYFEWVFAQSEGEDFHIYRVFGVGTPEARIIKIVNPIRQWKQAKVGLMLSM